jgi:hypothetical protein
MDFLQQGTLPGTPFRKVRRILLILFNGLFLVLCLHQIFWLNEVNTKSVLFYEKMLPQFQANVVWSENTVRQSQEYLDLARSSPDPKSLSFAQKSLDWSKHTEEQSEKNLDQWKIQLRKQTNFARIYFPLGSATFILFVLCEMVVFYRWNYRRNLSNPSTMPPSPLSGVT